MPYNDVLNLLTNVYDWGVCSSAKPDQSAVEQALAAGQTPDQAAASLSDFAGKMPYPPEGYPDQSVLGVWAYRLFWSFGGGCHFVALNTAQALGLQPLDPPTPTMPPVYSAEDAIQAARAGWRWDGQTRLPDRNTPEGAATMAHRDALAQQLPSSWAGIDPQLYWLLVEYGVIDTSPINFGSRPDTHYLTLRGFNLQMWLDNQWAIHDRKPQPWLLGGAPNPAAK